MDLDSRCFGTAAGSHGSDSMGDEAFAGPPALQAASSSALAAWPPAEGPPKGEASYGATMSKDAKTLRARIQELVRIGRVSDRDAATQLRLLDLGDDEAALRVAMWLHERGAAQAAFRTGGAHGTSLLVRSACGGAEARVELEGEYVGGNCFFSNFLSRHFGNTGSCVIVSRRWLPFCPTLLRFLHSPQPLFVEQLMYQQTLDSAMALHHCALYFLAAGEFFLEFFHIVRARQHLLLQGLEPEGDGGAALFPPDPSGEGFDIYHLPLQGVLMWLVALELPGTEVARVLRHVADPSATPAETAQEVSKALDSLFAPSHEYWRAVLHGSSGMGLSEQAEAEERERRHANLSCLHHFAARLRADLSRADAGEEGGDAPGGDAPDARRGAQIPFDPSQASWAVGPPGSQTSAEGLLRGRTRRGGAGLPGGDSVVITSEQVTACCFPTEPGVAQGNQPPGCTLM